MNGKLAKALRRKASEYIQDGVPKKAYYAPYENNPKQVLLNPNSVDGTYKTIKKEWKQMRSS